MVSIKQLISNGLESVYCFCIDEVMPTPESMTAKAQDLFSELSAEEISNKAFNMKIIIALLDAVQVATALPMPAVALFIGLVQLFFGITEPKNVVATYAHDAVWFIAGF